MGATVSHKHYVSASGQAVALVTLSGSSWSTKYFHCDHLGSVAAVSDAAGAVLERFAYEPFGRRRHPNGLTDPGETLVAQTTERGFTNHEHLDGLGLVHMNGRIYDPAIGRFLSADPHVQDSTHLQAYNRYAYALNNPLALTDPSGYFNLGRALSRGWKSVWHNDVVQAVVTIAIANYAGAGWAAAYSGLRTIYETGSVGDGLKAAAISWGTAQAFDLVGDVFKGPLENTLAHAVVGCISSAAGGGDCRSGAIGAAVPAAFSNYGSEIYRSWSREARVAVHAVIGGTASVVAGGKFANGAITGAFGYLFNCGAHDCWQHEQSAPLPPEPGLEGVYPEAVVPAMRAPSLVARIAQWFSRNRADDVLFGSSPNGTYHTWRHVKREGLNVDEAATAIRSDLAGRSVGSGSRGYTGTVNVGDRVLTYRAEQIPAGPLKGKIDVGRITVD